MSPEELAAHIRQLKRESNQRLKAQPAKREQMNKYCNEHQRKQRAITGQLAATRLARAKSLKKPPNENL
jgi:hypothetical protein